MQWKHLNPADEILPHESINFQIGHSQELFHILFNRFRIATWAEDIRSKQKEPKQPKCF